MKDRQYNASKEKKEDEWRLVSYVNLLHDGHPNRAEMAKL